MRIVSPSRRQPGPIAHLALAVVALGIALATSLHADESSFVPTDDDRDFWSFRPVAARTAVDRFLLEKLEAGELAFSSDADKRTLIRRVSLDLIGLPPSPSEVAEFLADDSPDAYDRLVDRLLDSPHFGERWARHWLDAVGYVDTVGFDVDPDLIITSEGKWRYRDYVIRSLNDDKPYDRFLTEQLAGDELVDWRGAPTFTPEIRDSLIATGFLRTAADYTHEDVGNIPQNHFGVLHDTIEIVSSSLLGLTLNCARCHDHKFDPLSQADYYRLMAVLTPAYNPEKWKIVFPYDKKIEDRSLADVSPTERAEIDAHNARIDEQIAALNRQLDEARRPARDRLTVARLQTVPETDRARLQAALAVAADQRDEPQRALAAKYEGTLKVSPEEITAALTPDEQRAVAAFNEQIASAGASRKSYGKIQALYDVGPAPATRFLIGGNYETPGSEIAPGIVQVLADANAAPLLATESTHAGTSGRRLAFARWLTAPDSRPAGLASRVMVNRIWQHLFGAGIVPTPDNFGTSGISPTHPELLEWLSAEFMEGGWRIKPIVRMLVLSSAYRQAAAAPPTGRYAEVDPDNALLWTMRLKRLESEAIRDSVLAVCDTIDVRLGGPPVMLEYRTVDGMIVVSDKQLPYPAAKGRRSVYLLARRAFQLSDMVVFDQPVVATNCMERSRSAVPLQSLSMLNGEFLWEQADAIAARLPQASESSREPQVAAAFESILSRPPTSDELAWSDALVTRQAALYQQSPTKTAADPARRAVVHLCHTLLNTSEFLYVP
jgi:hypothetical protein